MVSELAERQHGVVARHQLYAAGLGRGAINLRVERGRLHPIHRGVYAVGHSVLTRQGRWLAAVLAGGPGAVLSHGSAAAHWGVLRVPPGAADVTVARRARGRPGVRLRHSSLSPDEVTQHERIPVTTVARTLFDLAAVVSPGQLARAVNESEVRRLWDSISLADLLERHPRRPGAEALRRIVATSGAGFTRSDLEDLFLRFLGSFRIRRPATNVWLRTDGLWVEADCVWREERLIVELDGAATHATRAAYEHDRARDRRLVAAGWRVIRVTWRQVHEEPAALAGHLRAILRQPG